MNFDSFAVFVLSINLIAKLRKLIIQRIVLGIVQTSHLPTCVYGGGGVSVFLLVVRETK